jgi:hypothetical protein
LSALPVIQAENRRYSLHIKSLRIGKQRKTPDATIPSGITIGLRQAQPNRRWGRWVARVKGGGVLCCRYHHLVANSQRIGVDGRVGGQQILQANPVIQGNPKQVFAPPDRMKTRCGGDRWQGRRRICRG